MIGVVALVGLAACSDTTERIAVRPSTTTPQATASSAPPTSSPTANPATPPPGAPATSRPIDPSPTVEGTTTLAPSLTCDALVAAGFERRRELLASAPTVRPEALVACAQLVDRIERAASVRDEVAALGSPTIADLDGEFRCTSSTWEFTATNPFDLPIGFYAVPDIRADPSTDKADALSATEPAVVWRLEPDETTTVAGTFPANDRFSTCSLAGALFVAESDALSADPGPAVPDPGAGAAPEQWLLGLLERQAAYEADPTPDAIATFEDLRSLAYADLVEMARSVEPVDGGPDRRYVICDVTAGPSDRFATIIYERGLADDSSDSELAVGVFRRGTDHVWRWLGPALPFRGATTCAAYYEESS